MVRQIKRFPPLRSLTAIWSTWMRHVYVIPHPYGSTYVELSLARAYTRLSRLASRLIPNTDARCRVTSREMSDFNSRLMARLIATGKSRLRWSNNHLLHKCNKQVQLKLSSVHIFLHYRSIIISDKISKNKLFSYEGNNFDFSIQLMTYIRGKLSFFPSFYIC